MSVTLEEFKSGEVLKEYLYLEDKVIVVYSWKAFENDHVSIQEAITNDYIDEGCSALPEIFAVTLATNPLDVHDRKMENRYLLRTMFDRPVFYVEDRTSRYVDFIVSTTEDKYEPVFKSKPVHTTRFSGVEYVVDYFKKVGE